jgi:hypothetical protein
MSNLNLQTLNNDAHSLSDLETSLRTKPGAVKDADHQAWMGTIREWDAYFAEWADDLFGPPDSQLEGWRKRFDGWRSKILLWNTTAKYIPTPASVARIVDRDLPSQLAEVQARAITRKQEDEQEGTKSNTGILILVGVGLGVLGLAAIKRL